MRVRSVVAFVVVVASLAATGCSRDRRTGGTAGPPKLVSCPGTVHAFERRAPADESADGLPPAGTATEQAALAIEAETRQRYEATDSEIVAVDGRAWRRTAAGAVEVVPERIHTVRLTLTDTASCPDAPTLSGGVPLDFLHPTG